MNSAPLFSIIVPVYNVAPCLNECLNSVLGQKFPDWECICVDDGSTDDSGAILDEYAAKDSRFTIIHQANGGEGAARNAGLAIVKGEWVIFLDGDDVMLPGALELLAKCAKDDCSIVRFGFCSFEDGSEPDNARSKPVSPETIVDISHEIRMSEFFTYVWQHIYRRNLIDGIQFKKYKRGCDRVFLDNVLLNRADSVKVVNNVCYGYRLREGSAMNSRPSLQVLRDEMDHRLDIMEMIDASGKKVDYAGNNWLEGYFTKSLPLLTHDRFDDAGVIKAEWRKRFPRLLKCQGLSKKGRRLMGLCSNRRFRPIGDFIVFTLPYLRYRAPLLKPLTRMYRRLRKHGEFAGHD